MIFFESSSRSTSLVEHDLFRKPVPTFRDHALKTNPKYRSVQARRLEESAAVGGFDLELQRLALAIDRERHLDPGIPERPDAAEQTSEVAHLPAADREHHIAGA